MCRLLFVQNREVFSINEHLSKFASIAKNSKEYQGHGWGCSYLVDDVWVHYKNINPIWEDDLEQFGNSNRLIVHARSAFEDKDIIIENNMPFYDDKYIFVFNGELRGVKVKADGRIGAEKIFNFIKRFDKNGMEKALLKGINIIRKRTSYIKAMNIIIAEKENVYYSSLFSEETNYFQMHYKHSKDELIICSEVYPNETGWIKIENNSNGVFK
jgi:predicted glutamine amidotransferase